MYVKDIKDLANIPREEPTKIQCKQFAKGNPFILCFGDTRGYVPGVSRSNVGFVVPLYSP